MKYITLICFLFAASPAIAQLETYTGTTNPYDNHYNENFSTGDLAGTGLNRGQASNVTDRANQLNKETYTRDDFSGMGLSPGEARRAADRLNNQR